MGKVVSTVAMVVGGVALIATGVGAFVGTAAVTAALGGISAAALTAAAGVLSVGASLLNKPKQTKMSAANGDRLNVSLNVRAPRIIALGSTALATDLRDQEFTGADKEYLHRFIVNAAHRVSAVREIWFDDQLAWTSAAGVQGKYVGYLTVQTILQGAPGNAINISARMGASRRFTGCAYTYLRFKLTGNSKKTESPFAEQVPTRITIVGDGLPCYDPRQDSTQPGGSGAHRANDQSTWTWGPHARNPACQLGTWLLGWRIQNPQSLTWKLSVGRGLPPDRIDWPSIIEGANLCDEPVAKVAGGTEPRYRSDGLFSEGEDPTQIVEAFKACMNADLDDQDGLLRLTVFHNDLATPDADLTTADVLDDYVWIQTPPLDGSFNVVRGSYVEPQNRSLYQPADFTEITVPSPDGIERVHKVDFGLVQSKSQAERLAKQRAQRQQYGGTFQATFLATAWRVQKNSVVRLTFAPEGWTNKLFRVVNTEVRQDGLVPMLLREEAAPIYSWDREEGPAVQIAEPTDYAAGDAPIPQFLGEVADELDYLAEQLALAQEIASGKVAAFFQPSPPSAAESKESDLWFDTDDGNFMYRRIAGDGRISIGGTVVTFPGYGAIVYPPWAPAPDQRIAQGLAQAAAAIAAAQAAQQTADSAIDSLAALGDDGLLTGVEKKQLILDDSRLQGAWSILDAQAATFGITTERTAAANARAAWLALRNGYSPAWNDTSVDTTIDRATFIATLSAYDAALETLQKAISAKAATIADWDGVTGAGKDQLIADANTAKANAQTALNEIAVIQSDGYLSRDEKRDIIGRVDDINAEYGGNVARAAAQGVSTSTYTAAYNALIAYLGALSPAWNNTSLDTAIVPATFNGKFSDYYFARTELLGASADLTSANVPAIGDVLPITIAADYTGAVNAGQLPAVRSVRRFLGTNDVSPNTSYSFTATSGLTVSVNNTPASDNRGDVTLSALTAASGKITVAATYAGVTLYREIAVTRNDAPPPNTGGGGGGAGPPASGGIAPAPGSTTTHIDMSPVLSVTVGTSGEVDLNANCSFSCASQGQIDPDTTPPTERYLALKWVSSPTGSGSWSDVGAEQIADVPATRYYSIIVPKGDVDNPGTCSISRTRTGLSAGTYYFKLTGRSTGGNITSVSGTAIAEPQ